MGPVDQGLEAAVIFQIAENEIALQLLGVQASVNCLVEIIQGLVGLSHIALRRQPSQTAGIP